MRKSRAMNGRRRFYEPLSGLAWRTETLAPFRHDRFAAMWAANLVSNFGALIQTVGASWLMTLLDPSPKMVSLVLTAAASPMMLLSLVAGATADLWNRRLIMLIAQTFMLVLSVLLAVLTYMGAITPHRLLAFIFLIGCGTAVYLPAWQALANEQVPRSKVSSVVSLNSLALNLARTVGPAIGGIIIATAGPPAAFLANSVSYLGVIVVLLCWRGTQPSPLVPRQSILTAIQAGLSYAWLSPAMRAVLVRVTVFGLSASAISALLPLVARNLMGGDVMTYGLLYGTFGAGAVIGALGSTAARVRFSSDSVLQASITTVGASTAVVAMSSWPMLTIAALFVVGASWVVTLSTFNAAIQTASPLWAVGRTVAIHQMVLLGSVAISSWLAGRTAAELGLSATLLIFGALTAVSPLLRRILPIPQSQAEAAGSERAGG